MRVIPELYYERLKKALDDEMISAPPSVEIDLTNICRQACYYCNSAKFRAHNPDKATTKDYIKLIDSLPKGVRDITYAGGGEPLDNPDASEIINYSLQKGFKVGIITNGARLRHLKFNGDYRPNWIGVDIDTADPDLYWKIRKGNLSKIIKSITEVIDDLKLFGTKMTFKYLINDYNNSKEHLFEAIELAKDIGFDEFYVRVAYFTDYVIEPIDKSWWELEQSIKDKCEEVGIKFIGNFAKQINFTETRMSGLKPVKQCFAPLFLPAFTADGSVYWCCEHRGDKEYIIGNWTGDQVDCLFRTDLVPTMKKFIDTYKCAKQCRYFNYNNFASKIDGGLDSDDAGHTTGFF
jgi:MoaA/NifB/PqqE/SkfB family radical SAM enzyme